MKQAKDSMSKNIKRAKKAGSRARDNIENFFNQSRYAAPLEVNRSREDHLRQLAAEKSRLSRGVHSPRVRKRYRANTPILKHRGLEARLYPNTQTQRPETVLEDMKNDKAELGRLNGNEKAWVSYFTDRFLVLYRRYVKSSRATDIQLYITNAKYDIGSITRAVAIGIGSLTRSWYIEELEHYADVPLWHLCEIVYLATVLSGRSVTGGGRRIPIFVQDSIFTKIDYAFYKDLGIEVLIPEDGRIVRGRAGSLPAVIDDTFYTGGKGMWKYPGGVLPAAGYIDEKTFVYVPTNQGLLACKLLDGRDPALVVGPDFGDVAMALSGMAHIEPMENTQVHNLLYQARGTALDFKTIHNGHSLPSLNAHTLALKTALEENTLYTRQTLDEPRGILQDMQDLHIAPSMPRHRVSSMRRALVLHDREETGYALRELGVDGGRRMSVQRGSRVRDGINGWKGRRSW
ncbi:hypothetical protein EJ08DRAFT_702323 [Tothia fuscella]|uniref:SRR1-like domain-containing protein n=1 Tax=Tothia fuscella TaxID=1048955 RepID=A0A9P4NH25_9PEZI|nr:hypothetical protein EJ08DRAFT_702323 [Tothia fuscella]